MIHTNISCGNLAVDASGGCAFTAHNQTSCDMLKCFAFYSARAIKRFGSFSLLPRNGGVSSKSSFHLCERLSLLLRRYKAIQG